MSAACNVIRISSQFKEGGA